MYLSKEFKFLKTLSNTLYVWTFTNSEPYTNDKIRSYTNKG